MMPSREQSTSDRRKWWRQTKFGMFIHWSLFSLHGLGCGAAGIRRRREWACLAGRFNPRPNICEAWAKLARRAGMNYLVLTTKHADGFKLWASRTGGLSAVQSAAHRDLVAEFVTACRKHNLRIGFYYALGDVMDQAYLDGPKRNPAAWRRYVGKVHNEVRELMTGYGPIDILWYDSSPPLAPAPWQSEKLNTMVRTLQPSVLINNRAFIEEDFQTPEQDFNARAADWEACEPLAEHWEYHPWDHRVKSASEIVMRLVKCANGGGNYLLSISPRGDGSVPAEQVRPLEQVGRWLERNGESVVGTIRAGRVGCANALVTLKPGKLYLHFSPDRWHDRFWFGSFDVHLTKAWWLKTGQRVSFKKVNGVYLFTDWPRCPLDPLDTVLAAEYRGVCRARSSSATRLPPMDFYIR